MSTKIVQAECKSKLVRGFAEAQPIRAEARPRKVCKPSVEPEAKKAGIRIVSDPIFRPSNSGNETGDPFYGIAGHTAATAGEAPRTEGRKPAPQASVV